MKFETLRTLMANRPYFRPEDLHCGDPPAPHELVQLSLWAREGKVLRLKKGLYTLHEQHRRRALNAIELAEPLYRPSYLSLEWALSRYGIIPEAVGTFTSISQLKTAVFKNAFGNYHYQHIAPEFFFGFTQESKPAPHFLASPEKALLDFIHLSIPKSEILTEELLLVGYRLQNLGRLKKNRLSEAMEKFTAPRVRLAGSLILKTMGRKHA